MSGAAKARDGKPGTTWKMKKWNGRISNVEAESLVENYLARSPLKAAASHGSSLPWTRRTARNGTTSTISRVCATRKRS
jgi:hypothetical protein